MRRVALAVLILMLSGIQPVLASDAVYFVGILSPHRTSRGVASIERRVESALSERTPLAAGRATSLAAIASDMGLAQVRARARAAYTQGRTAATRLELDTAIARFRSARRLYEESLTPWLDPGVLSRLAQEEAMAHYARRDLEAISDVLGRSLWVQPVKTVDATLFPPDVKPVIDTLTPGERPVAAARGIQLTGWVVVGFLTDDTLELLTLRLGSSLYSSEKIRLSQPGTLEPGVAALLDTVGVPRSNGIDKPAIATRPWFRRWYVWAAVATVMGVGAGVAAANANPGGPGPTATPNTSVTVIFNIP